MRRSLVALILIGSLVGQSVFALAAPIHSPEVALYLKHLDDLQLADDLGSIDEGEEDSEEAVDDEESPVAGTSPSAAKSVTYRNTGEFLIGFVNDLLRNHPWCRPREEAAFDRLECIREEFTKIVRKAEKEGAADSVEAAILIHYTSAFTFNDRYEFTIDAAMLPRLANSRKAPKRDQTDLPPFTEYRFNKLGLENTRRLKKTTPDGKLDPRIHQALSKAYRKKIRGIGPVNPVDFTVAKYTRNQLGTLSKRLMETTWFFTADEGAHVVATKSGETRKIKLSSEDLSALALNDLLFSFEQDAHNSGSSFYQTDVYLEEAVIAAALTGDVDARWIEGILSISEFKQPKPDRSKFMRILGDVARTLLITQPQLLPFYTFGSIVFESVKRNKADRTEYNNETRRIPIRTH